MANKYTLMGTGIEIDYTIGGNPSFPAMTVTEAASVRTFKPSEITSDQTGLGTLVSVSLQSVDTGGIRLGFFLPEVTLTLGQQAPVTTTGLIETFGGPVEVRHQPTTWKCVHLKGTAEEVILPLVAMAPT